MPLLCFKSKSIVLYTIELVVSDHKEKSMCYPHQSERLSFVIHALKDFGPRECMRCLRHAREFGTNVVYGFSLSEIFHKK